MEKSKVYFTDMHTTSKENLQQKLSRLIKTAGMGEIDFERKFTAIKIHFGEPGNLAYLRPNYAKTVADIVREAGGKPFLTDCNTLYVGGRKNALDHLESAYVNGFSPFSTGCHVIIADGLKGTDEALVPVDGGEYVKEAKIGRAIMDADIFISLTHFKGHESTGFGGALKNIGMGCGSRAGKMEMHSSGKPHVSHRRCIGCGTCAKNCAHSAITLAERKATIDHGRCVGCGRCIGVCPVDAVRPASDESNDILNKKIAEYSAAVLRNRPHFHISLVIDVSPYCDCHSENDIPIVPDVGMFASFDPVALDVACANAVNRQPAVKGSILDKNGHEHHDHFTDVSPETDWKSAISHAVKLNLGRKEYELITI
ncbi:MAG TPA: 4Fe-4S ferredoxin [Clostridiales bacterium]|nr:4Fe-4S ferredoxin [Clostridiales bacterium]